MGNRAQPIMGVRRVPVRVRMDVPRANLQREQAPSSDLLRTRLCGMAVTNATLVGLGVAVARPA